MVQPTGSASWWWHRARCAIPCAVAMVAAVLCLPGCPCCICSPATRMAPPSMSLPRTDRLARFAGWPNARSPRAKAATHGRMAARTRAPGTRASSTAGASTAGPMVPGTKGNGGKALCRWVLRTRAVRLERKVHTRSQAEAYHAHMQLAAAYRLCMDAFEGRAHEPRWLQIRSVRQVKTCCRQRPAGCWPSCMPGWQGTPFKAAFHASGSCMRAGNVLQGYGTFESPDGARYVGNWAANLKHGIGKKTYANGDAYEGLWRNGKAEGPGRCGHRGPQACVSSRNSCTLVVVGKRLLAQMPACKKAGVQGSLAACIAGWLCCRVGMHPLLRNHGCVVHQLSCRRHCAGTSGTTETSTTASGAPARCMGRAP